MRFDVANDPVGLRRHPTKFYECSFHLFCAICIVAAEKYKWMEGSRLKVYLLCYLLYRFVTEWIRPEPIPSIGLTMYQVACLVLAACLIGLWLSEQANSDREQMPFRN